MAGLTLGLAILAVGNHNYTEAYRNTNETGTPLVVLVGADWCPGCRTMKHSTIPQLKRDGQLDGVNYVEINMDKDPDLARRLMKGGTIPQLITFAKTPTGWQRHTLTGAKSTGEVRGIVRKAIKASVRLARRNKE